MSLVVIIIANFDLNESGTHSVCMHSSYEMLSDNSMVSLFLLLSWDNFSIDGDSHILLHSTPQLVHFHEIFTLFWLIKL